MPLIKTIASFKFIIMKTLKFKKLDDSQMRNIKGGNHIERCKELMDQMQDMDISDYDTYFHTVDEFNKAGCGRYN